MSNSDINEELISGQIREHQLPEASDELKDRILDAARDEWERADGESDDVPWTLPVLRLAACIAIAVVLVRSAEFAENALPRNPRPIVRSSERASLLPLLPNTSVAEVLNSVKRRAEQTTTMLDAGERTS